MPRRPHRPRLSPARSSCREAGKAGVKPIIGCEVYVADDRRAQTKGYAHLTLLAESNEGYANLIKLSSLGYLEGYYYKPRVDWELLERHAKGIVALSGCLSGPRVARARRERPATRADLDRLAQIWARLDVRRDPERRPRGATACEPGAARARRGGLPLVATGDVHYLDASDSYAHEALLCIQSGDTLKNPATGASTRTSSSSRRRTRWPSTSQGSSTRSRGLSWRCAAGVTAESAPGGSAADVPGARGQDAFDYLVELCEKGSPDATARRRPS